MIGAKGRGATIVPLISLAASRGQMRRFSKRVVLESSGGISNRIPLASTSQRGGILRQVRLLSNLR